MTAKELVEAFAQRIQNGGLTHTEKYLFALAKRTASGFESNDIVITEAFTPEETKALVEAMKANGIKRFVNISSWSGEIARLKVYADCGARIEGLTQVGEKNWDETIDVKYGLMMVID